MSSPKLDRLFEQIQNLPAGSTPSQVREYLRERKKVSVTYEEARSLSRRLQRLKKFELKLEKSTPKQLTRATVSQSSGRLLNTRSYGK